MTTASERVTFRSVGGDRLTGTLTLPRGRPAATALFAHCFTCDSRSHAAVRISQELAARGVAVLRFDFTGLGSSEGLFADTTFTSNIDDLRSAATTLGERLGGPHLLIGHSLGGTAVLAAAPRIRGVRAVVTVGAPAHPDHVLHLFSSLEEDGGSGTITADIGGRPFRVGVGLIRDLREQSRGPQMAGLDVALLVMHSPSDRVVSVENARQICGAARHPKSFIALDGADHMLSDRADSAYVAQIVSAWASRYVASPQRQEERRRGAGEFTAVEADPDHASSPRSECGTSRD